MGLGLYRTCIEINLDEWPPPLPLVLTEDSSEGLGLKFSIEVIAAVLDINASLR